MSVRALAGELRGGYHTECCTVTYHSAQVLSLQ
jgi:hypothetical protein